MQISPQDAEMVEVNRTSSFGSTPRSIIWRHRYQIRKFFDLQKSSIRQTTETKKHEHASSSKSQFLNCCSEPKLGAYVKSATLRN